MEEWRQYGDGIYEVSNMGGVRRTIEKRPVKPCRSSNGYLIFAHHNRGKRTNILLHRAVASAFIGPIPDGMQVNHIDGNKLNPCACNLEYVTASGNSLHAIANGLSFPPTERATGDDHWTRRRPDLVKRGTENGAALHPECILRGESCPASKLSEEAVRQIRQEHTEGTPKLAIAAMFNITRRNVSMIVNMKTWRHIT